MRAHTVLGWLAAMQPLLLLPATGRLAVQPFGPEPSVQAAYNLATESGRLHTRSLGHQLGAVLRRVETLFGLRPDDYTVKDVHEADRSGLTHVYLKQTLFGVEVANGDMNLSVDRDGRIVSVHSSFARGQHQQLIAQPPQSLSSFLAFTAPPTETTETRQVVFELDPRRYSSFQLPSPELLSPQEALALTMAYLRLPELDLSTLRVEQRAAVAEGPLPELIIRAFPFTVERQVPAALRYIQTTSGKLSLCWELELEMSHNWFQVHVAAERNGAGLVSLVDWVADATYHVFPLGSNDPLDGDRVFVRDPADNTASPLGWHALRDEQFTTTRGNNVIAQENLSGEMEWRSNHRPDGGQLLEFDFMCDLLQDPKDYVDAAVTNLFYWNNIMHDLFYRYGFDEAAGNFQEENLDHGGKGHDAVIADAQDGSGFDNANFATPPDGRRGKMRMYVWDVTEPRRDGDLESGIIIHEYAHGISTRLTGGPANSNCLGWGEAGGMGEGWGDFFATILRMHAQHTRANDFEMGTYANGGKGIRKFPYSTSLDTNPSRYSFLNKAGYWGVHAKGEVWAVMLYEVYWNLVDKHGFTDDWYSASLAHGNTLALQLVVEAMKLQPCRPGFLEARDAILLAERQLTRGENACEIWRGFAKRGLGPDAKIVGKTPWGGGIRRDDFSLPPACM